MAALTEPLNNGQPKLADNIYDCPLYEGLGDKNRGSKLGGL